jgi:hypothetical protein
MPTGRPVFIDANAYVRFFDTVRMRRLFGLLEKAAPNVFVTRQIVNEVERNKAGVAADFLGQHFGKLTTPPALSVPDSIFAPEERNAIEELLEQARSGSLALQSRVEAATAAAVSSIATSTDQASKELSRIWAGAVDPNPAQIERARWRRETGNPPGKKGDPLGDQLNWEQYIDQISGLARIWVVTHDADYRIAKGKPFLLNPVLLGDVVQRCGPSVEVRCFDTLADGLTDFLKAEGLSVRNAPKPEEIQMIAKEERARRYPLLDESGLAKMKSLIANLESQIPEVERMVAETEAELAATPARSVAHTTLMNDLVGYQNRLQSLRSLLASTRDVEAEQR